MYYINRLVVYTGVFDNRISRSYLSNIFILYIKHLPVFVKPIKLYYNGYNDNLYNKLLSIEKGLLEYINMHYYDRKKYVIDTFNSVSELSKYTRVKTYGDKLLIYGSINQAVCKIPNGNLIEIIPYSCKTSKFRALDKNIKYTTLGINTVKKINQQQLTLLRRISHVDSSITKNEFKDLEKIRRENEKKLGYIQGPSRSNRKVY